MYLQTAWRDPKAILCKALSKPPLGAGLTKDEVGNADRLELWASNFNDPGPDFCEFRLFKGMVQIATKRIKGY